MPRTISAKVRVTAVKDYVTSGDRLSVVAERHGMSTETLRRFVGDKVRRKGVSSKRVMKPAGALQLPFKKERKERVGNTPSPNANRRWTKEEDGLLRDAVYSKFTVSETVDLLGRSDSAIYCRKSQLVSEGFIDETRFTLPTGIKRTRHAVAPVSESPIVAIIDEVIEEVKQLIDQESVAPVKGEVNLRELAGLVKEFGVSITMNVTAEGTEVKMYN